MGTMVNPIEYFEETQKNVTMVFVHVLPLALFVVVHLLMVVALE
jgi:hypothetical protein